MLYINCSINNHPLQAFVDSGAQMTIMSKKAAMRVGILDLVDIRFAGVAVGVGTGKILGKVHIAQLQIGDVFFPCSITVMDDSTLPVGGPQNDTEEDEKPKPKDMDFLLGLDMLKRFKCNIDLGLGKLKFRIGPDSFLETDFLHEKDLDVTKGGTKGFDATKANEELMAAQKKYEEEQDAKRKTGGGGASDEMEE
jgi:DNA damage-inducible protein 1